MNGILELLLGSNADRANFENLLNNLQGHDQQTLVIGGVRLVSKRSNFQDINYSDLEWWKADEDLIASASGFLKSLIAGHESRREVLVTWLTGLSGAGVGTSVGIRRATIVALSDSKNDLELILEKGLQQFGDQLYIKHTPILQQEGME